MCPDRLCVMCPKDGQEGGNKKTCGLTPRDSRGGIGQDFPEMGRPAKMHGKEETHRFSLLANTRRQQKPKPMLFPGRENLLLAPFLTSSKGITPGGTESTRKQARKAWFRCKISSPGC
ncbi:hypothetical protein BOX24_01895 [Leptospirillum ferriphilum]|uniref:Uncharacterized protein n=1 Tax=Leptospirillum ferriphilum TaxID=178606 RepID=A0A1V3SXJ0_9BACT|nr:hypothetical protein ABH19_09740 [Leptospirillum sp. Group II 'CF-1']OOH74367.1 hypothetical protein BOX24_01895 [Leptospirillum ferriphilum]